MLYSYLLTTFLGAAYAGTGPFEKGDLDRYVTFYSSKSRVLHRMSKIADNHKVTIAPTTKKTQVVGQYQ